MKRNLTVFFFSCLLCSSFVLSVSALLTEDFSLEGTKPWQSLPPGFSLQSGVGRNGTAGLLLERRNAGEYSILKLPLQALQAGREYEISVYLRGENLRMHGEDPSLGGFCLERYDSRTQAWKGGEYPKVKIAEISGDWKHFVLSLTGQPGIDYVLGLYLRRKYTGKLFFDDLEVRETGVEQGLILLSPRHLDFSGADQKVAFMAYGYPEAQTLHLTVTADGRPFCRRILSRSDAERQIYSGRLPELPKGKLLLSVEMLDGTGKVLGEHVQIDAWSRPSNKAAAHRVTFDRYGRTLVNGKPYMVLGIYGSPADQDLARIADAGFNSVVLYSSMKLQGKVNTGNRLMDLRHGLDRIQSHGLKLIFSLKDQYEHKPAAVRQLPGRNGVDQVTEAVVSALKDHPALLAWYINDEESSRHLEKVTRVRSLVSGIDPRHPVWSLSYRYGDFPKYGVSGDVMGVDPYPISAQHKPMNLQLIMEAMNAAESTALPVWPVAQIFNWSCYQTKDPAVFRKSRFPTEEEMRTMPLLMAVRGARNFIFYSYYDIMDRGRKLWPESAEREWRKVRKTTALLKEMERFIMSIDSNVPEVQVKAEKAGAVLARAFRDGEEIRVVITALEENVRAEISIPGHHSLKSKFGLVKNLGQGRYEFRTAGISSDILF